MSYISSKNSYAIIQPIEELDNCFTIEQVESSFDIEAVTGNYVKSNRNFAQSFVQFYMLNQATFETHEETDTSLELLGLPVGAAVNIWLRRGETTISSDPAFDLITDAVYKGFRRTTRVGKARGIQLIFENGIYTHGVTPSAEIELYMGVELLD